MRQPFRWGKTPGLKRTRGILIFGILIINYHWFLSTKTFMRQWHLKPSITCALPHKINYYDFSITSQNTSKWLRRIPPSGKSRIKPKRKTIKELEEIDWNFCVKIFCHKGVKFFQDNRKMLEGCITCMKDLNFLSCVMCPLSQPVYLTVQNDDLTVYTIWHNGRDWIIGLFNTAW